MWCFSVLFNKDIAKAFVKGTHRDTETDLESNFQTGTNSDSYNEQAGEDTKKVENSNLVLFPVK